MQRATRDDELIVPSDEYFVLGDNRNDSEDSRFWGFVPRSAIVGRPLLVYFSLHRPEEQDGPISMRERLLDELSQVRVLR